MRNFRKYTRAVALAAIAGLAALTMTTTPAQAHSPARPTVVLVHGAWADESSWSAVARELRHEGYRVEVPSNPLRGVASDSASLASDLRRVRGPIVLVGHSYGGMVITNAARGNTNVKSLVYVDAYVPDQGDTVAALTGAQPGSALAVADPTTVFDVVPIPNGGGNADLYVKADLFPAFFAAGLPAKQAAALAAKQHPLAASALTEPSGAPAWKTIPSWDVIGTADRIIPPATQRMMAHRAKSRVVAVNAPHLSMVAKPGVVADVIEAAARR